MIRQSILRIVSNPITLSLVIGLIIILLLPPIFNKYNTKLISTARTNLSEITLYHDFKSNGNSNRIVLFSDPIQPHVIVWENGRVIDQWDHQGEYAKGDFFFFADYNHDSLDELYFITVSNDSIYLHGINPYVPDDTGLLRKKIDWHKRQNNVIDCCVKFIKATDLTNDGYHELVFSVSTGYTAYPRKIYAYDIKTSNMIESDPSCFPILKPMAYDLNRDGVDEFICNNSAFTNCDTFSFPTYNDHQAWLVVFDKNLNFLFDPVSFGEYMTGIKVQPIQGKDSVYLFAYQFHHGTKEIGNRLFLFDLNGRVISERDVPDYVHSDDFNIIIIDYHVIN